MFAFANHERLNAVKRKKKDKYDLLDVVLTRARVPARARGDDWWRW